MIPINELARGFRLYQKEYEQKAIDVLRSGWYVLGKEVEVELIKSVKMGDKECRIRITEKV